MLAGMVITVHWVYNLKHTGNTYNSVGEVIEIFDEYLLDKLLINSKYCRHMSPINTEKSLQKHAYSNILKISSPKTESFQIKNSDIFHISAQSIDCDTR